MAILLIPPPLRILYPTLNPSRKGRDSFDSPSLAEGVRGWVSC
ncbi:hypothetical protein [Helicobacter sp. T3_23-1059]